MPRPSVITGNAFSVALAATPSCPATAAIVVAPGVETATGAGLDGGSSAGWACALATSTFEAYPGASATSFSPAAQGAMYSCAPLPPIWPTSPATRYQRRPVRSKIRS